MAKYIEEIVVNGRTYQLPGAGRITEVQQGLLAPETIRLTDGGNDILETFSDGATMHSVIDGDNITQTYTSADGTVTTVTITVTDDLIIIE